MNEPLTTNFTIELDINLKLKIRLTIFIYLLFWSIIFYLINIYGKSKLLGENGIKNILQDNNQYIILRTSWVMGSEGNNFAKTMLRLLKSKAKISVVYDQIGCMTSSKHLSNLCWLIFSTILM